VTIAEIAQADVVRRDAELRSEAEVAHREAQEWASRAAAALREFFGLDADAPLDLRERDVQGPRQLWETSVDGFDLVVVHEPVYRGDPWTVYRRDRVEGLETRWIPSNELQKLDRPADLIAPAPTQEQRRDSILRSAELAAQSIAISG
jgi:hypothetical protein